MRAVSPVLTPIATLSFILVAACKHDEPGPGDGPPPEQPAGFERFCGDRDWGDTLVGGTVNEVTGGYAGVFPPAYRAEGAYEFSKIIPPHPFHATTLRAAFGDTAGSTRLRIMGTLGRSYPAGWPDDVDLEENNLVDPIDVEVGEDDGHSDWLEVDLSALDLFLLPTQHYVLAHEYLTTDDPPLAISDLEEGQTSRSQMLVPGVDGGYGIDGDFRIELEGEYFCTWDDADRWFDDTTDGQPFDETRSGNVSVADLDGDGHQDLVTYGDGPEAWLGDGTGAFAAAEGTFADASNGTMTIFADIDNDGDQDAFAAIYTSADGDGDRYTLAEGDCNDTDADVNPGETESTDGRDNDCDGVADDGLDTTDDDGDGVSIAAGDCDDTRDDVFPGAPEARDSVDNDCDQQTDEDFYSRILLNDGNGGFVLLPGSGVEVIEPTTAGAFADANEDGVLDLYFGNWLEHYPDDASVQDRYFEGDGDGTFTDALAAAGLELAKPLSVYGVEWTDYNNDGHQDIFVGNYHLYNNQLWQNQGDGTFEDVARDVGVDHDDISSGSYQYPGGHTYGGDWGDVDNDGDMDFYMCNLAHPRYQPWSDPSMFVLNSGAPDYSFENLREEYGFAYDEGDVNAQFADFDNDMDLDLMVASLYPQHYGRLYRNDGEAGFTDVTYEADVAVEVTVGAVWVDVDEDGDEDLALGTGTREPFVHLFINRVGQDNHWVNLRLEGTSSNRDGIGARVTLETAGVTQIRDIQGGGGLTNNQRPKIAHFGLADHETIDSVTVRWVGGDTEAFTGIEADGWYLLVEGSGVAQQER